MFWIILAILITIIIGIFVFRNLNSDAEEIILSSLATISVLIVSVIVGFVVFAFNSLIYTQITEDNNTVQGNYICKETKEIVSLQDNTETQSCLFIGSGHIKESQYYYFIENTKFGYKTNKILAENCYITYISQDESPKIEKYVCPIEDKIYWFAMPLYQDKYIIYCPQGTINQEFKVDLK